MKYLLLVGLIAVIWLSWSKRKAADTPRVRPSSPDAEKMVSCAQCGVYLPESESISDSGLVYCCEAHRVLGHSADHR